MSKAVIEIRPSGDTLKRAEMVLANIPNGVQKASMRAINRSLVAGRTAVSKGVTSVFTVKARDVKATLKVNKASAGRLNGELISEGRRIPLRDFRHSPSASDTTGGNRQQIRVSVKKGSMKPLSTGFKYRGHIFTRVGRSRLPVKKAFSISIPEMIDEVGIRSVVQDRMQDVMEQRLDHEINQILSKGK